MKFILYVIATESYDSAHKSIEAVNLGVKPKCILLNKLLYTNKVYMICKIRSKQDVINIKKSYERFDHIILDYANHYSDEIKKIINLELLVE